MSRLIENLTRLQKTEPQPIGFAALGRPAAGKSRMQLLISLLPEKQDSYSGILSSADAALVSVSGPDDLKAVEKVCRDRDGIPAGILFRTADPDTLQKAAETSCDFLVFPVNSPLMVTQNEKLGRVLELDPNLSDGLLRTINDLPVDAVVIPAPETGTGLTLDRLMLIRRLAYIINKPIIAGIPGSLAVPELQAIWDMGATGVIVEAAGEKSAENAARLRQDLEKLTPTPARRKEKVSPLLPVIKPEALPPHEEQEEDDE